MILNNQTLVLNFLIKLPVALSHNICLLSKGM